MTAEQKIKRHILGVVGAPINGDYDDLKRDSKFSDRIYDAQNDLRMSGEFTKIKARGCSRHYECDEVAFKLSCGSWVGWTYWHGGGKHGEPEAMDWMNDAYDLNVTEEEKVVTVRKFEAIP